MTKRQGFLTFWVVWAVLMTALTFVVTVGFVVAAFLSVTMIVVTFLSPDF